MTKLTKRLLTGMLVLTMSMGMLTGCGNKAVSGEGGYSKEDAASTKVMVIGDYDVYLDELLVYAVQALVMNSASSNTIEATQSSYKDQTLSLIRETKILYDVAIHNDVELNDDDMATTNNTIKNFKNAFPQEFFDKYGISDEAIEKVFVEQTYVSKFENDIKNDMGKNANAEIAEGYDDYSFNVVYYMVFPTVEVNEDDVPATDTDGSYIDISEDDKADVKAKAEEAVERIRAGEDAEKLAEEYGITAYSSERSGYIGSYSEAVNEALDGLKNGECTDVIEETLGYAVVVMKSADDEDLKASYVYAITSDYVDTEYETLRNQWLASIPVDTVNDMEGTVWADFSLKYMVEDLEEAGVLGIE